MAELSNNMRLYRRYARLEAEMAGLEWNKDGEKIQALSTETSVIRQQLGLPNGTDGCTVNGTYWGAEDLCGVWMLGSVDEWPFAWQALDFLAGELSQHTAFGHRLNLHGLVAGFGPAIVDPVFDLMRAVLEDRDITTQRLTATWRNDEGREQEIYARADQLDDPRFEEGILRPCAPGDEGATIITIAEIDMDDFQGIIEFIEHRDAAARRALRGVRDNIDTEQAG